MRTEGYSSLAGQPLRSKRKGLVYCYRTTCTSRRIYCGTIRFTPVKNSHDNLREIIAIMSVVTRAANTLGFSSLKKEQEQVIGQFIDGKDVCVFANWFWKEPLFHHIT